MRIAKSLEGSGVRVFIDTQGLMVTDKFATRLSEELERSDALLFLHTAHSASSDWCHAEIYAANSHGLQLLRIRKGDGGTLPDPIERLLSGIHYLEWRGPNPPDLRGSLARAISHSRRRVLTRCAITASAVAMVAVITALFFSRWEAWQLAQKRQ